MIKYIVYLTICTANCKIYIGVHQTENPEVFDGYIGCGVDITKPSSYKKSKTPFQYAVNKYGTDKFKRITLKIFDNKEDAFLFESQIVNEEFIKRSDTYNVKLGGEGGCADSRKSKIYVYDLNGIFVAEFDSALECNKFFKPDAKNGSSILKAIKKGQIVYNHQFSKEKLPYMKKYYSALGSHGSKRKIGKYDSDGNLIETFESVLSARRSGYENVNKALKLGRKCKGYFFKYIDN